MPRSRARQYPEYVPAPLREDFEAAHLILKDSPQASATLARRALQGIMRDFYGAKPGTLFDEITEVEAAGEMDAPLVKATHAVRDVGNIGAYMSKDVNVIMALELGEAESLLELIELLLDETYVARHLREQRVSSVLRVAAEKQALKALHLAATHFIRLLRGTRRGSIILTSNKRFSEWGELIGDEGSRRRSNRLLHHATTFSIT